MKQYTISCRVILVGATMLVDAESEEEALAKADAHQWDDIDYGTAELADWKITGKPKTGNAP